MFIILLKKIKYADYSYSGTHYNSLTYKKVEAGEISHIEEVKQYKDQETFRAKRFSYVSVQIIFKYRK